MSAPGWAILTESRPGGPLCGPRGPPTPPGGTSWFPLYLQRGTAAKRRFLSPLVVPEVAQFSHSYTSITRRKASPPRGTGMASQSRAQSPPAPSAPRAGPACGSCACCAVAAPDPRAAGAAAICAVSARASCGARAWPRGASPFGRVAG